MFGYFQPSVTELSGQVSSGDLANASVTSGIIASGAVSRFHVASGSFAGFELGSGAVVSGRVASGQVGFGHLANASVRSGTLASGQVSAPHLASGCLVRTHPSEQDISGIRAVAWGSGGCAVVPAERQSGLRLPAIGVVAGNYASGDSVPVVVDGPVTWDVSGVIASGQPGRYAYVGSGGLIVNLSGFMGGLSSGAPTLSGSMVQRVGVFISGGLYVLPDGNISSGLLSGLLGQF